MSFVDFVFLQVATRGCPCFVFPFFIMATRCLLPTHDAGSCATALILSVAVDVRLRSEEEAVLFPWPPPRWPMGASTMRREFYPPQERPFTAFAHAQAVYAQKGGCCLGVDISFPLLMHLCDVGRSPWGVASVLASPHGSIFLCTLFGIHLSTSYFCHLYRFHDKGGV